MSGYQHYLVQVCQKGARFSQGLFDLEIALGDYVRQWEFDNGEEDDFERAKSNLVYELAYCKDLRQDFLDAWAVEPAEGEEISDLEEDVRDNLRLADLVPEITGYNLDFDEDFRAMEAMLADLKYAVRDFGETLSEIGMPSW
ncbi:hypothetical protein PspLS_03735 [Pyricularia sp. CBS 133598]|nr:hypothetical protein PspLS_03735 [Pyricularia sp. CBS 133598]